VTNYYSNSKDNHSSGKKVQSFSIWYNGSQSWKCMSFSSIHTS